MSMAFLPLLAKGTTKTPGYSSSVVNVSSISGSMKGSSMGQFSYASSKAASTHLGRMLATTFKDVKVRVNTIAPGVFPSEMTAGSSGEDNKSQLDMELSNPSGRTGHDSDMAATILFLAGKGGVFYNDQVLYPDGGEFYAIVSLAQRAIANILRFYACSAGFQIERRNRRYRTGGMDSRGCVKFVSRPSHNAKALSRIIEVGTARRS